MPLPVLLLLLVLLVLRQAVRDRRRNLLHAFGVEIELVPDAPEIGPSGALEGEAKRGVGGGGGGTAIRIRPHDVAKL